MRNWIVALIKERKICVKTHDDIIYASTNRGLPQGGGLSPTLWSMIADSLLKWLSKRGVYAQGYADDGVVLVIGTDTVCDIMQRTVKGIEEWCTCHQLAVNPTKTEMVLFTRRFKIQDWTDDVKSCVKQVKYLGVILDSKLNWKAHVDAKCQKAITAFYQLCRTTGKT